MNYVTGVLFFKYLKTMALSFVLAGVSASAIQAANLTPKEAAVCPNLRVCVDIIRRHDSTEFDYNVLEAQFRRFGPSGRDALFGLLDTKDANADIARMISVISPLSARERSNLNKNWSLEQAGTYLPLLLDKHPLSRDLLLLSLGSDQPAVREGARRALIQLPENVKRQPISDAVRSPLLTALTQDPIVEAAPYLARLNAETQQEQFSALLQSTESAVVSAAYFALHRNSPSQAFNRLLSEMGRVTSPQQSRAIGTMLLNRHVQRSDGFYLKFAKDISGDKTRPISTRASGLHAVLVAGGSAFPEYTPARAEALAFLVRDQASVTQDVYLPFLKRTKSEREMNLIWTIAQQEKWINRDRISTFFMGEKIENKVIGDLLQSDDIRSFSAGIQRAKPIHNNLIRAEIDHANKAIRDLARKKLGIPKNIYPKNTCRIVSFDADEVLKQMPFFDSAWIQARNRVRVSLDRKYLTTAHPSKTGWIAGYDLENPKQNSIYEGGALVHFDNRTGAFKRLGNFSGPIAILPNLPVKLGKTTEQFWVIDDWGGESSDISAYAVDLSGPAPKIKHLAALPKTAHRFSVAPNGDLLMQSKDAQQVPLRLTPRGKLSRACSAAQRTTEVPAPN